MSPTQRRIQRARCLAALNEVRSTLLPQIGEESDQPIASSSGSSKRTSTALEEDQDDLAYVDAELEALEEKKARLLAKKSENSRHQTQSFTSSSFRLARSPSYRYAKEDLR